MIKKIVPLFSVPILYIFETGFSFNDQELAVLNSQPESNNKNNLSENKDFIILESDSTITETMVFYPGGLVDPNSYLIWQDRLITLRPQLRIITVKMPSNLAVLNAQKGDKLFKAYSDTQKWFYAGHSLGGAMASNLVAKNKARIDALIYLAAYPADDRLIGYNKSILSISASEDGLATPEKINNRKDLLPTPYEMNHALDFPQNLAELTLYFEISGGNHAQFGHYGDQSGDLPANITREEQQLIFVELIYEFLERL
jgi:hypothetical protein